MPTIRLDMASGFMPWGKYAGYLLTDVPSDYLRWLTRRADHAEPELKREIRAELDRRRDEQPGVMYVWRSQVVHLSIDGDPPLCGSFWKFKGDEKWSSTWPQGHHGCAKGCFR